ncbi:ATP-binding protein [Dyadobacter sp. CY261]|uniref:hybrid sensor histidine kinase/response regulator transcription factor n=1 Tax=Dyadobacter sp. CY261 TaxID=2907203 RepID=UPI001F3C835E|nr:hybrid sensor histidine kinase/response regulator transcription factor [Dyadobacter sp. CY261]MCF0072947.1 ATP-binding protein [Dyadobacter sp. CY261]
MKAPSLVLSVFILLCTSAKGQPGAARPSAARPYVAWVKHYGPENGLAHREVNAIFQDRQGFMWFGTRFGLSRFDGKTFTNFTKDRNGLAFDDIQSIAQDADGLLWLMGPYGESRISLFNPLTGATIPFEKKFGKKHIGSYLNIPQRLVGSPDGTIFFANHRPAILSSYHPKSGLRHVRLSRFQQVTIRQTTVRNTVWAIADGNDLVELDTDGRILRQFPHSEGLMASCLGQRNAGTEFCYLTVNTSGEATHAYWIDQSGNRQELSREQRPSLPQQLFPVCYAFDKSGLIWDGTRLRDSTGVILLDISDQLAGEAVINRCFFADQNGSMWLGTSFGVYQVKVAPNYFRRLFYNASYTGEKTAAIRGIVASGDTVYASFEKFGIYAGNANDGSVRKILSDPRNPPNVTLTNHSPGRLLAGVGSRLVDYDRKTGAQTVFELPNNSTIWTVHPFGAGQWLAGGRLGLWWVHPEMGQIESFTRYNQFQELAQSHVLHIAPDRKGTFWVCSGTGLYTVDPVKGITARYWSGGKGRFYLPADAYAYFYQDQNGFYWLGTSNAGMIRWDRLRNKYRQFRRSEGLTNDNIHAIYPDRRGRLWLSSDRGIMQFDPIRLTTRAYFTQDGITHDEFNRIAHFQDKTGRLYFGGLNGITSFDPRDFENEKPPAPLPMRLVSFRQFDHSASRLKDKTEELTKTGKIVIRPGEQTAVIDFTMLNFTDAEKDVYAFQLQGLDNAWTQQTESSLRLGNLPYGKYRLLVKGQAANGQWSANTLAIGVDVRRPFYLQVWFLAIAVLLLMAAIWGWLKWRIWNHRHEQLRLQAEIRQATARIEQDKQVIERQARSLHQLNEAKSRFFANISHEFRTPLTVILGMTSELKRYGPDEVVERSHRTADLIERNGSRLLRLINQILDLSKLESGAMSWQPIRVDLIRFARYVAESFDTMAAAKGVQMHFHSDEPTLEADFDKDKLQDILSNLLTNAIKFTPTGGHVYLRLTNVHTEGGTDGSGSEIGHGNNGCGGARQGSEDLLGSQEYYAAVLPLSQPDGEWISIHICNTGPGIEADKVPLIFDRFFQVPGQSATETGGTGIGLALVRELVSLMQGELGVRSAPGRGAEFVVRFRRTRQAPFGSLPVVEPVAVSPHMPDATGIIDEVAEEKPVLLLVEDNEDVAAYIVSALNTDYRIIRAGNGQGGIDLALEAIPDLILTDVMMPVKDGYELCDTLKNSPATSHIPIVMLTARAGVSDRISGLRRGVDAYLTKPFQREELQVVLSNLLQSRRRLWAHYGHRMMEMQEPGLPPVEENESLETSFLQKLRLVLEAQWVNNPLSMEAICHQIGMSRSSLHRKMVALTGMSVTRYDRSLRMAQARHLLTTTPMSISEVAYAVGFEDPKYFTRLFSEELGQSPTEFRRLGQ